MNHPWQARFEFRKYGPPSGLSALGRVGPFDSNILRVGPWLDVSPLKTSRV